VPIMLNLRQTARKRLLQEIPKVPGLRQCPYAWQSC
jgi:hypothetical protein